MTRTSHKSRRPTHPGEVIREIVLPELAITLTQLARKLHIARQTVSDLIHERKALTPDIAIKLTALVGGTADTWMRMQHAVDLWETDKISRGKRVSK